MGLINRQKELEIIAGLAVEKYENSKEVVFKHLLCCPITGLLMRDPVVGTDGFIYDRRALIALYERFKGGDAPHPFSDDVLQRPLARENAEELVKHNS